jgi:hypothetical protein
MISTIPFPRELSESSKLRVVRPSGLFVDEQDTFNNADRQIDLQSSEKILAAVRKIADIARSRNNWNHSDIEVVLQRYLEGANFDREIEIILAFTYHCYLQARLTEESSYPSFWDRLTPLERKYTFLHASELYDRLSSTSEFNELPPEVRLGFNTASLTYEIPFKDLDSGLKNNIAKFIGNALRAKIDLDSSLSSYHPSFNYRLEELTPEEMAERSRKADAALERQRHLMASMSSEELEEANAVVQALDKSLRDARGIENWE